MPAKKTAADRGKATAGKAAPKKGPPGEARAEKPRAQKPSAGKARARGARAVKRPVLDELFALLPELDDSGLAFLLEQAKVHRYNMEVERLNAISERAAAGGSSRGTGAGELRAGELRIERSADGSTYHLIAGNDWKMFTAEEMASLVRITRSGEGAEEISRRLRAWLARERKDVYLDLGLNGPSIGMARDIAELLGKTFPKRS
jgi:hypothetical protein